MNRLIFATAAVVLLGLSASDAIAQTPEDREAVRAAVLDYVDALYDVEPDRIERSVHTELAKKGVINRPGSSTRLLPMNYEQLHALAGQWNENNQQEIGDDTVKEVIILDLLNDTASAKLVAQWGIDYMHLAKIDGSWTIMNVLWQFHPSE